MDIYIYVYNVTFYCGEARLPVQENTVFANSEQTLDCGGQRRGSNVIIIITRVVFICVYEFQFTSHGKTLTCACWGVNACLCTYMYVCVCVCVHAHVCVCVWMGGG